MRRGRSSFRLESRQARQIQCDCLREGQGHRRRWRWANERVTAR